MNIFNINDKLLQSLLILFIVFFPLSVSLGNLLAFLLIIVWLLDSKKDTYSELIKNPLVRAFSLFFFINVIGLIWTENILWGLEMVRKMLEYIILFPVLVSLIKGRNPDTYLYYFLGSITFIAFLSFLIWFGIVEPFKNATLANPTPLMTHVTHTPFVAFGAYIAGVLLLFRSNKIIIKVVLFLVLLGLSINVFITGGRVGQVSFFVLTVLLLFQKYGLNFKSIAYSVLAITIISFSAYNLSPIFKSRINQTLSNITNNHDVSKSSSLSIRYIFVQNSLTLFKDNPLIGVGTGDFQTEYDKVNKKNSPAMPTSTNPHNMYLLVMAQFGILGLILLINIFYQQFKLLNKDNQILNKLGLGFIFYFFTINFGESYMLGHFTSFQFVFLSALFFAEFDND